MVIRCKLTHLTKHCFAQSRGILMLNLIYFIQYIRRDLVISFRFGSKKEIEESNKYLYIQSRDYAHEPTQ